MQLLKHALNSAELRWKSAHLLKVSAQFYETALEVRRIDVESQRGFSTALDCARASAPSQGSAESPHIDILTFKAFFPYYSAENQRSFARPR